MIVNVVERDVFMCLDRLPGIASNYYHTCVVSISRSMMMILPVSWNQCYIHAILCVLNGTHCSVISTHACSMYEY